MRLSRKVRPGARRPVSASFRPLAGASLLGLLALAPAARADTLVTDVKGLTLNAQGSVERFTGLLIGSDGRILRLMHEGDLPPAHVDYLTNGHGAVLMPGLIDSHVNVLDIGLDALTLDLSDTHSLAEAQQKIAAYAAKFPGRPWIIGSGWNEERWGLTDAAGHSRLPTAAEIDAVVSDRPVWLIRSDGHAGWANARALEMADVTAATRDPAGGHIERLAGGAAPIAPRAVPRRPGLRPAAAPRPSLGKPSGVLFDAARALVDKVVPPPRPEDLDLAVITAQTLLLRHGVTTVADMGTTIEGWQAYRRAGDTGRLALRIMAYARGTENMVLIGGPGPSPWLYDDRLRLNGVLFTLDGTLGSHGAWLKAPYADAPASTGQPQLTDTQLKNLMSRAAMDHFQVAVHAAGDGAVAAVLGALDAMSDTYTGDRRWRIEQAQVIDPADLPRLGQHGLIASMQPAAAMAGHTMAEARLGSERLAGAFAWKSVRASGTGLAFGSGAPGEVSDPFAGLAAAISRQGADGLPAQGWQMQEALTPLQALAAYTTGAAYAGFAEGRIGRLAPGMQADFLLVDRDPTTASPAELRATRIRQVWVGGRLVMEPAGTP